MAMIAVMADDYGINPTSYRKWAISQVHYALGDAGRSWVVGFGKNLATKPHHREDSCPEIPATCNYEHERTTEPDPHVLYGAMVGGPGRNDEYVDDRTDYKRNEVACDYNAGFQSAVAGRQQYFSYGTVTSIEVRENRADPGQNPCPSVSSICQYTTTYRISDVFGKWRTCIRNI